MPPCHQTQPLEAGVLGLILCFIMQITSFSSQISFRKRFTIVKLLLVILFYDCNRFMKRHQVQLVFLKAKAPTLMAYLNYFQERVPHVTQAHGEMERLLHYLDVNSKLEEKDLAFCFEVEHTFTVTERKGLVSLFSSAFTAAHSKLVNYVVDGAQPASKFLDQVRVLDPRNLLDMDHDFNSTGSIPGFDQVPKEEWELYVMVTNHGPLTVKQSKDGNIDLMLFGRQRQAPYLHFTK